MPRIKYLHWKPEEAAERAQPLRDLGYEVDHDLSGGPAFIRQMGEDPPAAVVIDLSRMPSQGRDIALMIRKRATTRRLPLVFVGGDPEKVERTRQLLPDAAYTGWEGIGPALEEAIANPPEDPIVHDSTFAAYAGKPLVDKLGIKADTLVGLVNPPEDFLQTLGDLPEGARAGEKYVNDCGLTLWFTRSSDELEAKIAAIFSQAARGPVWIAWPKKSSGLKSDLSQQVVRETSLANGLVDYKICSIDQTWSALLFRQRKNKQQTPI